MNKKNTKITAIIVARNSEKYIDKSIESLINQENLYEYKYEILIVDGFSDDKTINVAEETFKRLNFIDYKIFYNKNKTLASGWNIGIKEAKGDFIIRIDAHSTIDRDYIYKCINYFGVDEKIICVGGKLTAIQNNENIIKKVISLAYSSKFAIGNSYYRFGNENSYVDTVAYGVYIKDIYAKVGGYSENLTRNQDIDFHKRVKKFGGKIYFTSDVKSYYSPRTTIKQMISKSFNDGFWVYKTANACNLKHFIPSIFFICNILIGLLILINIKFLYLLMSIILMHMVVGFYANRDLTNTIRELLLLEIFTIIIHISYGCGTIVGFFKSVSQYIRFQNKGTTL